MRLEAHTARLLRNVGYLAAGVSTVLTLLLGALSLRHWLVNPKIPWEPAPAWHGTGVLQSTGGAKYPLYLKVRFERKHQGLEPTSGRTNLIGTVTICTPQRIRFDLDVSGTVDAWWPEDGKNVVLYLHNQRESNPKLSFLLYGAWQGADLVLEDRGTLANSFNADGMAKTSRQPTPSGRRNAEITLRYGEKSAFDEICPEAPEASSQ